MRPFFDLNHPDDVALGYGGGSPLLVIFRANLAGMAKNLGGAAKMRAQAILESPDDYDWLWSATSIKIDRPLRHRFESVAIGPDSRPGRRLATDSRGFVSYLEPGGTILWGFSHSDGLSDDTFSSVLESMLWLPPAFYAELAGLEPAAGG